MTYINSQSFTMGVRITSLNSHSAPRELSTEFGSLVSKEKV